MAARYVMPLSATSGGDDDITERTRLKSLASTLTDEQRELLRRVLDVPDDAVAVVV